MSAEWLGESGTGGRETSLEAFMVIHSIMKQEKQQSTQA